jgi:hypothetical protein
VDINRRPFSVSMGRERHRDGYYRTRRLTVNSEPVVIETHVSPVMLEPIITPAETRNVELPIPVDPVPKQHIFH